MSIVNVPGSDVKEPSNTVTSISQEGSVSKSRTISVETVPSEKINNLKT